MSDSYISSALDTIVAPEILAILLLSVFLILLITETFPFNKKCYAKSETPFSVITISGFHFKISLHIRATSLISYYKASVISDSLVISMFVIDSPFLYSNVESSNKILGFLISLLIFGCVISLLTITPSRTQQSSKVPPGIFSTFAYLFISRFNLF